MGSEGGKTRKLVHLFIAATLIAAPGCGSRQAAANECWDRNNDGYCDDDGSLASGSYYINNGARVYSRGVSTNSGSYSTSSSTSTSTSSSTSTSTSNSPSTSNSTSTWSSKSSDSGSYMPSSGVSTGVSKGGIGSSSGSSSS